MIKQIILPHGYGQTCNQIIQIAHWIPLAKKFNLELYFPGFKRYARFFSGTKNNSIPCFPSNATNMSLLHNALATLYGCAVRVPHVNMKWLLKVADILPKCAAFTWDDSGSNGSISPKAVICDPRIAKSETLWVQGWLYRDTVGLQQHKEAIRQFFSPIKEIQQRVDHLIQLNRKPNMILVGVHLRRGDYQKWVGGKYYYDDETFRMLMQQMSLAFPNQKLRFLLVSNQVIEKYKYVDFDYFLGPGDSIGDLYSLAACDYIIGPPSTFTIWASYYGDIPLYEIKDPAIPINLNEFKIRAG